MNILIKKTAKHGNQIIKNSDHRTSSPRMLKKFLTPIGETSIGVIGAKKRSELKGQNITTPSPPLVKPSKNEWDNIEIKRIVNSLSLVILKDLLNGRNKILDKNAKKIE